MALKSWRVWCSSILRGNNVNNASLHSLLVTGQVHCSLKAEIASSSYFSRENTIQTHIEQNGLYSVLAKPTCMTHLHQL